MSTLIILKVWLHDHFQIGFDSFCLIRLVLGAFILLFASKYVLIELLSYHRLSKSKSFYYITAASLSAITGILIIIILIMKKSFFSSFSFIHRLEASNTVMGATAIAYSFGLNVLFRHSMFPTLWRLVLEHYRIVIMLYSLHTLSYLVILLYLLLLVLY